METIKICIADVTVCLHTDFPLECAPKFAPFLTGGEPDVTARFQAVQTLPVPEGDPLARERNFDVYAESLGGYSLIFRHTNGDFSPYAAVRWNPAQQEIHAVYLPQWRAAVQSVDFCLFHILWELLMLHRSRLIFHAACVELDKGGILFSGPSGIGKSTQADLWCSHRGAKLLNGDRPVLSAHSGTWRAYGSPYAGSSRIYRSASCPVEAIVLLGQAERCSVRELGKAEAFRRCLPLAVASPWHTSGMEKICDLTEKLIAETAVYELLCTPNVAAVELLERQLFG